MCRFKKKGAPAFVNKRGSQFACKGKWEVSRGKEKKKKDQPGGKGATCGTPHLHLHKRGLLYTCGKR